MNITSRPSLAFVGVAVLFSLEGCASVKEAWVGRSQDLHQQVMDMKSQDEDTTDRGAFIGVVSREKLAAGTAKSRARGGYFLRSFDEQGLCITIDDGRQVWSKSEEQYPEQFVAEYQKDEWAAGAYPSLEEGFPAGAPWPKAATNVRVRAVKVVDEPNYSRSDPLHTGRPESYWRKYTTEICVPAPPPSDATKVVSLARMGPDGKLIIAWRVED